MLNQSKNVRLKNRYMGLNRDYHDIRDLKYSSQQNSSINIKDSVDLTVLSNDVYDQSELNSSTSFAVCSLLEFLRQQSGLRPIKLSELFTYYISRKTEGTIKYDSGSSIRAAIKATIRYGCAPESMWPYEPANFRSKIPRMVWRKAKNEISFKYLRLDNYLSNDIYSCLSEGFPFSFGMSIYSSFRPDEQGIIPIPSPRRDSLLGYHCLTCVGYTSKDIDDGLFIVKNSWGRGWGNKGFCLIPAKMLIDNSNAFDFWTVRPSSEFMVMDNNIDNNSTYLDNDNDEEYNEDDNEDNDEEINDDI